MTSPAPRHVVHTDRLSVCPTCTLSLPVVRPGVWALVAAEAAYNGRAVITCPDCAIAMDYVGYLLPERTPNLPACPGPLDFNR